MPSPPPKSASGKTLFIAHRGESLDAPENTCASYRLAMMRFADGYELDILPSSDGVLVCCHNATTKYTCGGVDKLIEETPYAELRQLNACNNKLFYSGEPIPKFADALKVLKPGRKIYVEFKNRDPKWIAPMMAELQEAGLGKEQIVVISFFSEIISAFKKAYPDWTALFLTGFDRQKDGTYPHDHEYYFQLMESMNADGLDVAGDLGYITPELVQKFHDAGKLLGVWTIDDLDSARKYVELGVDVITSNRASFLKENIQQQ